MKQAQRVTLTLLESREVPLQIKKQGMLDANQGIVDNYDNWLPIYIVYISWKRELTMLLSCNDSCSGQMNKRCPDKQYVLHQRVIYHVCILLTSIHYVTQRRWAAELRKCEKCNWNQVLFIDESRFSLQCDKRRVLVSRERGTQKNQ